MCTAASNSAYTANFACRWSFFCVVCWPFWYLHLYYVIIIYCQPIILANNLSPAML